MGKSRGGSPATASKSMRSCWCSKATTTLATCWRQTQGTWSACSMPSRPSRATSSSSRTACAGLAQRSRPPCPPSACRTCHRGRGLFYIRVRLWVSACSLHCNFRGCQKKVTDVEQGASSSRTRDESLHALPAALFTFVYFVVLCCNFRSLPFLGSLGFLLRQLKV